MSCNYLESASSLERRLHLLRCPECRAAATADRGLARGIERLRAEAAPEAGLARTLAAIGAAPVARAPRSRKWKATFRRGLIPAGTTTALLAAGWLYYIDINPTVKIPTPVMPSVNAFDFFRRARAAEQDVKVMGAIETNTPYKVRINVKNPQAGKPGQPSTISAEKSKSFSPDEVTHVIGENREALALLRQGLDLPYQSPPIRSSSAQLPYFAEDRELARVLSVEARVREARGDRMGAANSRLDAMQLGAMIPHGSTLIGKLVGIACEAIGRAQLWRQVDELSAPEARAAARRMERIVQLHVPEADTLQEEAWFMQANLMEIFRYPRWRMSTGLYNGEQNVLGANLSGMAFYARMLPYSKRRIMHDVTQFWNQNIRDARLPYCARKLTTPPGAENQEQAISRNWDPLLDILCPVFAQTGFADTTCEVQDVLLMTMFALRAYHQEHHAYPETLAALVPEYLSATPADPFVQSQPLRYRRVAAKYLLYSVGPDGKDDGGKPIVSQFVIDRSWSVEKQVSMRYAIAPDSQGDIVAGVNTRTGGN
jgi:hypothetical protein